MIEAARDRYPGIVAIVITGFGTVKDAVDAIKRGASDFIAKPFQFDELIHVLQAMEQRRLTSENAIFDHSSKIVPSSVEFSATAARCRSCFTCSRRWRARAARF